MVRIKCFDSGEIWECGTHFSSESIKWIIKGVRWYRRWFPENCQFDGFTQLLVYVDEELMYVITVSEHWTAYSRIAGEYARCEVRRSSYGK